MGEHEGQAKPSRVRPPAPAQRRQPLGDHWNRGAAQNGVGVMMGGVSAVGADVRGVSPVPAQM
jgi:hypothetical protein